MLHACTLPPRMMQCRCILPPRSGGGMGPAALHAIPHPAQAVHIRGCNVADRCAYIGTKLMLLQAP